MFPTLFSFGIGVPKMNYKPIKLSLQIHIKHSMNLDKTRYQSSKQIIYFHFKNLT
jgi:hypothetical protein